MSRLIKEKTVCLSASNNMAYYMDHTFLHALTKGVFDGVFEG